MTVLFYNKGIEMIDLPKIVHYKSVTKAVPSFLNEVPPPVVGYINIQGPYRARFLIRRV